MPSYSLMELDDGLEFSFTDKRRFARVRLLQDVLVFPSHSYFGINLFLLQCSINLHQFVYAANICTSDI